MDYKTKINVIKVKYQTYEITLEEARALAEPIIIEMNAKSKTIAKKYKRKFKLFTFEKLILNQ